MTQAADFDRFIDDGWTRHGDHPEVVAETLADALALVDSSEQAARLAQLSTHVLGEHLGRWDDGVTLLRSLAARVTGEKERRAILRNLAVLQYCAGRDAHFEAALRDGLDPERPPSSTRVRVLALAAAALAAQGHTSVGMEALEAALELAAYGPDGDDPAAAALAATGNNVAVTLEEKPGRTESETVMMVRAAEIARRYWAVAGGWLQVERAEYRLARSLAAAGRAADAIHHAEACLRICEEHDAPGGERFFGFEALAHAHHAAGDSATAARARDRAAALLDTIEEPRFSSFCKRALNELDRGLREP
jgi:hypothetical protein